MQNLRQARLELKRKREAAALGTAVYNSYCDAATDRLESLYADVEQDFVEYYRLVNQDDEDKFSAKFTPKNGKLDLLVDFYGRGQFPPAAYHSEGHQDGMGVCLYLALMKRVLGSDFQLAVLDDVVMSVDSQHRRQFCALLKRHFPNTQFVITTHDQVWAEQMKTEGLVSSKSSVSFRSWSVDAGPVVNEIAEVWVDVDGLLSKNDVPAAAHRLRRYLEFVAGEVADKLGARPAYHSDFRYDMGELLSAVIGRQGELLRKAKKAAESWSDKNAINTIDSILQERSDILQKAGGEQWVINRAVHYNDWAALSKQDFQPVVEAFKELLHQFRCDQCESWIGMSPKVGPVDLRCSCGRINLNLKSK